MAEKKKRTIIDCSKIEVNICALPALKPAGSRGAYAGVHIRMRGLKAGQWFLVPGSSMLERAEKQALRTSIGQVIKKEQLDLAFGEDGTGAIIVFSRKCKGAPA